MSWLRRLKSAWHRHGARGFFRLIGKNISYCLTEISGGRLLRKTECGQSEFDAVYGTDTESIREVGSLDIESDNSRYAVRYQPSPHRLAAEIISALPIDHSRFTFIDFGAGKGRVLLIASEFPFSAVIGIEFSRELCTVANHNIDKLLSEKRRTGMIQCLYADVTTYPLPSLPLICYFYNPFDRIIMQKVAEMLSESLKESRRDIYIVYVHPEHRDIFDTSDCWEIMETGEFHVVYRVRTGQ